MTDRKTLRGKIRDEHVVNATFIEMNLDIRDAHELASKAYDLNSELADLKTILLELLCDVDGYVDQSAAVGHLERGILNLIQR
jgi:hypothetical protein